MALWSDPFDELVESLDRVVPPARADSDTAIDAATMQADHVALLDYVQAVTARPRDPDRRRRAEADPRVQLAMEHMARAVSGGSRGWKRATADI